MQLFYTEVDGVFSRIIAKESRVMTILFSYNGDSDKMIRIFNPKAKWGVLAVIDPADSIEPYWKELEQ